MGSTVTEDSRREGEKEEGPALLQTEWGPGAVILHDLSIAIGTVPVLGFSLFAASGVWPPLVAVKSASMEPNLQKGDLVFVSEPGRYAPGDGFRRTGVIPATTGREIDYRSIGSYGSVVAYSPPESSGSPIIHRAYFWVEEGENWYEKAHPEYVDAENRRELQHCPAPHAGFITKGDANSRYDQASGIPPVRPDWITGTAHGSIPYLGWIRLGLCFAAPTSSGTPDDP